MSNFKEEFFMKKVAFYGRYSSANQTEQSIEGQLHVCEKYAEQNGLQIVAHYIDRAISGKSDNRPQFQKMISDSASGMFEGILLYKLDRFARNRYHSAVYKHRLRENGVRLISATEHLTDTPEGIMLEAVLEGIDEFYSAELSQKVTRGLAESFHKGYYLKKHPPFGYQIRGRKLVPDDVTAPLAAEIFKRYDSGERITDIVSWLNCLGLTNQLGNRWRPMNISTHLKNRIYMGEYYYGQFEEPMPCPALIGKELFDSVQEKLKAAAHRRRERSDYEYLLTGKLVCGFCGHQVSGSTAKDKHYYYCRHCKKENRSCYPADVLHTRVLDALSEYLCDAKVNELTDAVYEAYRNEQPADERPAIKAEIAGIGRQLQNAVQAILDGFATDALKDKVNALEVRKTALQEKLNSMPAMPVLTREHFAAIFHRIVNYDPDAVLRVIVNQIILRGDDVIVCINLTDESNTPPMEQILFSASRGEGRHIQNKIYASGWFVIAA
jgi:DNA invertase Pin-like site-specific DNA recombinase